jgi:U4/U6.U5 tri-snRNP-associated protein 2
VALLDKKPIESFDLNHKPYRPGFVGMNNIKQNDYLNVIVQSLAHVAPLRNFLILENFEGKPELGKDLLRLCERFYRPAINTAAQCNDSAH